MAGVSLTNEQRFKKIQNYIDRMPSLSTTVTKVLEVCNQPNTSPNDLNRVISLDPVLTGQVLKLINSAYYSLPNQITSLARAIIMLGLNTVKNLALSTAILGSLGKEDSFQCLPMDTFWAHSICTGVVAKALAARKKIAVSMREEYFVAGLLHDLGKIPLNNCFMEEYRQSLALADLEEGPLYRSEEMILGFDHGMAGKKIAEKWKFSPAITESLCFHHNPAEAPEEHRDLIAIVALANIYANIYDFGSAGDKFPSSVDVSTLQEMVGVSWEELVSLNETVTSEIEKAQVFLKVSREA